MGKGELSIVVINEGVPTIVGLPKDIHMLYIDDEHIQQEDTGDGDYIKTMLSVFGKRLGENTSWGDARKALYDAVRAWGNSVPVIPTSEESKHIYEVSIMIPAYNYRVLEKATKKRTYPAGLDGQRTYRQEVTLIDGSVAEVRFFPPMFPIDDLDSHVPHSSSWRVMAHKGVWVRKITSLEPAEVVTPSGVFICKLEPDPGYE